MLLDEINIAGYGDYARAAIDFMAEPLGGRFTDTEISRSDKGSVDGEIADTAVAIGVLSATIREALEDNSLTTAERIQIKSADRDSNETYNEKRLAFTRYMSYRDYAVDTPVSAQTLQDVRLFLTHLNDTISGNTANKARKNLGRAWRWARQNLSQWPEGPNLFMRIERFKEQRHPRYVPPEDDFWKVYEIANEQDQVMLLTFLHLGARRSEVFRLKRSDIDFGRRQVRLWTKGSRKNNFTFLSVDPSRLAALQKHGISRYSLAFVPCQSGASPPKNVNLFLSEP